MINAFNYHVSCPDGKISVRINLFTYFSSVVAFNSCVFFYCRPFIVYATFLTDLVGCWSFFCLLAWAVGVQITDYFNCWVSKFLFLPKQLSTAQARRQKKLQHPTRPVENVAVITKGLQERKHNHWMGRRWKIGNKNK